MRCGVVLLADPEVRAASHTVGVGKLAAHGVDLGLVGQPPVQPPDLDEWDFDQDLRHARGMVDDGLPALPESTLSALPMPASPLPAPHYRRPQRVQSNPASSGSGQVSGARPLVSFLAWTSLGLGMMGFVCGAVLLGWSFVEGRGELWRLGMPITVGGQVGLLLGLVLQLERIWQGSRHAADKLEQVDEQLLDLRHSTALLGATHGSASQAFYAHMAEGAHPQMLLADVKSQLDLLSLRLSQR